MLSQICGWHGYAEPTFATSAPCIASNCYYLLTQVIYDARVPWCKRYHFIADRLRAVKQDLIIQQPSVFESISILEPMVRFYFLAEYWGKREDDPTGLKQEIQQRSEFVPVLNQQQLEECLKYLLSLYDEVGDFFAFPARPQMEALYQLQYLGETEALRRGVALPQNPSQDLRFALKMSLEWYNKKYSSVIRYSKHLTAFLRMAFSFNLPKIRRYALEVMNTAYSNKNPNLNSHYPLDHFTKLLNFRNPSEASRLCEIYEVMVCKNKVMFLKKKFMAVDFDVDSVLGVDNGDEYVDESLKDYKLCNLLINYLDDAYTTDLCRDIDALSIC
ncbi:uncharacterized protein LOC111048691 [Nilaparvata lugens]|uniref:uncharacterized protein LOC111048691 n=1 Tax=Nilaparvata lugens TaxID=108931 RepID=UPI00193CFD19|nr:uncharacterized protein LOC111048691 [Nilaparvata lugens]